MKRLLLDTHILMWSLAKPSALSPAVRRELEHASNQIWISPASLVEAYALERKHRIRIPGGLDAGIEPFMTEYREAR